MLQSCRRTHGAMTKRHDRILDETAKALSKAGWNCVLENRFEIEVTDADGRRTTKVFKPDLVIHKEGLSAVIDATICADNCPDPNGPHWAKVQKYSLEQISRAIYGLHGSYPTFSSITLNCRRA